MRYYISALAFALAACGSPSNENIGGISRSEAEALDDAASMLDDNAVVPVPVDNLTETGNAN